MNVQLTQKNEYDYSLSLIRLISMISIVACHCLQFFGNSVADWLNIGVQIFILLSGYLYSKKKIVSFTQYIKKQINKLFVEYYIVVTLAIIISFLFKSTDLNIQDVCKLMVVIGPDNFTSLKHLWFIRYIFICYIFLPFFLNVLDWIDKHHNYIVRYTYYCGFIILNQIIGIIYIKHLDLSLINCFIIGMILYRVYSDNEQCKYKYMMNVIAIVICMVMIIF